MKVWYLARPLRSIRACDRIFGVRLRFEATDVTSQTIDRQQVIEVHRREEGAMASDTRRDIFRTLDRLHAAQRAGDVDGMLSAYSTKGQFMDIGRLRSYFDDLVARNVFRERTVDASTCETFVYRDSALVRPIVYHTPNGPRCFSFHLLKEGDGEWRIIDNRRSQLLSESAYEPRMVANAGRVIGSRGMVWIRRLDAPIDEVWRTVSTKEGLDRWWITRSVEIDLRPGGLFKHHWTDTIRDFEVNSFIEFESQPTGGTGRPNLSRIDLYADGECTVYSFIDGFQSHPLPLSMPWTASGWHCGIDTLESTLTGRNIETDFGLGGEFYWRYLRRYHALARRLSEVSGSVLDDEEWRGAYLTQSLPA